MRLVTAFELIFELMTHSSQLWKAVLKKNRVWYVTPVLAALLVQIGGTAHAFTLGDLRGAAVLGRPLDVTVRVQAAPDETLTSTCVSADVFYADARQTAVKVTVSSATGAANAPSVRVQSSAAIDEPMVTVELRANCGSNTARRYVLLSDFPVVAVATATPLSSSGAVEAPPVLVLATPAASGQSATAASVRPSRAAVPQASAPNTVPRQGSVKPKKSSSVAVAIRPAAVSKPAAPAPGKAVLKLDPLDLLSDRIDSLDAAMLFAPTEDALRYSRQISTLEGDVKALRTLAASNDAKLSDLTAKLQQAQASQIPWWLIYGLVALLLASLAALAWLWQRRQQRVENDKPPSWWHGPQDSVLTEFLPREATFDEAPLTRSTTQAMPIAPIAESAPMPAKAPVVPSVRAPLEVDQAEPAEPLHGTFEVSTAGAPFEFNSIRHISVEPILDIRQQAEFFVSLGQTDQALHILKKQIAESFEPNPLVYLDLITLYHALGMKTEFRECRDTFHRLFNAVIPDFSSFNQEGHDLEAYPEVLSTLVSTWPRMDALAFLSACIFHEPDAHVRGGFDLAAFRDLLLLHALAEALLVGQHVPKAGATPGVVTRVLPTRQTAAQPAVSEFGEGAGSRMLDLDFSDLGAFAEPPKKN